MAPITDIGITPFSITEFHNEMGGNLDRQTFLYDCEHHAAHLAMRTSTVDTLEQLFPRFRVQIGVIGAAHKIVKIHPGCATFSTDDGKYHVQRIGETHAEAFQRCLEAFPGIIKFCLEHHFETT